MGLLSPTFGGIMLGDVHIGQMSRRDLLTIGYLPQTPVIFEGSVRENLDPYRSHSDHERMLSLRSDGLDHLRLDDFIRPHELTAAYSAFFGLARIFLLCPQLLLLDEVSSASNRTELATLAGMIEEFNVEVHGRISIIQTSYNLDRGLPADAVVVPREGRVNEVGSPSSLSGIQEASSEFASMLRLQLHVKE
jgi:ABC-type multidrug transport system fused ATPase/permease subunit